MTNEKFVSKTTTIDALNKDMTSGATRNDHPLQRFNDNWNSVKKGNLCSDILQNNPVPELIFCEEVDDNGFSTDWIIDGNQRTSTARDFINNKLAITKSARHTNIPYVHYEKDANGKVTCEERWFNIKNKKFKDLPEELKSRFLKYEFRYVKYLDCSPEDIKYHMSRYNDATPMSKSQRSFIELGEDSAKKIDAIYAMDFFDRGYDNYTTKDHTSGSVRAIIIECVMACNYFDDWKKETNKSCIFLKDNATDEAYEKIEDYAERLEDAIGDDDEYAMVRKMFNRKNTFLFFKLFDVFTEIANEHDGITDTQFVDFMNELRTNLHTKYVGEDSWDTLSASRSTKDKSIIEAKISLLTSLMKNYLEIEDAMITDEPVVIPSVSMEDVDTDVDVDESTKETIVEAMAINNVENNTIADDTTNNKATDDKDDEDDVNELYDILGLSTKEEDNNTEDVDDEPIYEENLVIADILSQKDLIITNDDIAIYKEEITEMIDNLDCDSTTFDDDNENNLTALLCAYVYLYNNGYDEIIFSKWLNNYCAKNANDTDTNVPYTLTDKFINSANKYASVMA